MKIKNVAIALVYLAGCVYLTLPTPMTPDLSNAERSNEPGDTWQHPDQKGFYTNSDRQTALSEMQSKYSLVLFGYKIPSYRLNYRPEESFEMVRDQMKTTYLEEIVYPMRNSLFVNGYEPENAPEFAKLPKDKIPQLFFAEKPYFSKVTLKPNNSSWVARLFVWTLIFPSIYLIYLSFKKTLRHAKT